MSKTAAASLESQHAPQLRSIAALVIVELLSKVKIQPEWLASGGFDVNLRIRISQEPDLKAKQGCLCFSAHANLDSEYACFLDGFGPYTEKHSGQFKETFFAIPQNVDFADPSNPSFLAAS